METGWKRVTGFGRTGGGVGLLGDTSEWPC